MVHHICEFVTRYTTEYLVYWPFAFTTILTILFNPIKEFVNYNHYELLLIVTDSNA